MSRPWTLRYGDGIRFAAGDRVAVRGSSGGDATTRETIYLNVPAIVRDIAVGRVLLVADGELELEVTAAATRSWSAAS